MFSQSYSRTRVASSTLATPHSVAQSLTLLLDMFKTSADYPEITVPALAPMTHITIALKATLEALTGDRSGEDFAKSLRQNLESILSGMSGSDSNYQLEAIESLGSWALPESSFVRMSVPSLGLKRGNRSSTPTLIHHLSG